MTNVLFSAELNSDRIKRMFGSYGVEILATQPCRISSLYSFEEGRKITRTLALVEFTKPIHSKLSDAHTEIENGGSIGSTLRACGWGIEKKPVYYGATTLTPSIMAMMNETVSSKAALFTYQLWVSNEANPDPILFCAITEIHSPQYLTLEALEEIHGTAPVRRDLAPLGEIAALQGTNLSLGESSFSELPKHLLMQDRINPQGDRV